MRYAMYIVSQNNSVGIVNLASQYNLYIDRNAIRVSPLGEAVYTGKDLGKRFEDVKEALNSGVNSYDFSKKIGDWKQPDIRKPESQHGAKKAPAK